MLVAALLSISIETKCEENPVVLLEEEEEGMWIPMFFCTELTKACLICLLQGIVRAQKTVI